MDNFKEYTEQFAALIIGAVEDVKDGEESAVRLYKFCKDIAAMASDAMKDEDVLEELKDDIQRAGKGYNWGGFTIAHSVRQTWTPQLTPELSAMKALVSECEKASKDAAKKGKPGAMVVTEDGEAYEVPAGSFKSGADVFTIKAVK